MGISKRAFAELTAKAVSDSFVSQSFSSSFHQNVNSVRLNLTGVYNTFVLTPSGSGRAKVVGIQAHPNDSANSYSMSYGVFSVGVPGGAMLQGNAGFFTGVITGGTVRTASLNTDASKLVIAPGSLCYLSSTNHTGAMAVEIFYKTEVI